jgi:hypothetical protein
MVSGEFLVSAHAGAYRRSIRPGNRVQPIRECQWGHGSWYRSNQTGWWWRRAERWIDGTPRWHLILSQAHPTQTLSEEIRVGVQLKGAGSGNTVTPREAMMAVALGMPSPSGTCLTRAMVPAQHSPRLGELMVAVGRVSRREEDYVVAVTKRHEIQAPKPDHCGQWKWTFGVCNTPGC